MSFLKILNLCEQYGFIRPLFSGLKITTPESAERALAIGPTGHLLLENLKSEWRNSAVNNKDISVFYSAYSFTDTYDFGRKMCSEKLPFGVADCVQIRNQGSILPVKIVEEVVEGSRIRQRKRSRVVDVVDFFDYFKDCNYLRSTVFVSPDEGMRFFHEWQRQRRVWWRKFSSTPGRYHTTDMQTASDGSQLVEIRAKYPWGVQTVESLMLHEKHPLLDEDQLRNRHLKKRVQSSCVISVIPLATMFLNTICDAYEELPFIDTTRSFFRFHRKLAPYKVSLSVAGFHYGVVGEELRDLALYICKKFRANNMTTLLLPSSTKAALEEQFINNDNLGVPYTVQLNESTLKNGIVQLRSRDTTLKEEVHINDLPSYLEMLFKNY